MQVAINLQSVPCKDEQGALNTVKSFLSGIDMGNFELGAAVLADKLTADYSSLFGVEDVTHSKSGLIKKYQKFLSHFDQVTHELSGYNIKVENHIAHMVTQVRATHWQGHALWAITGTYRFTLDKVGDDFVISHIVLDVAGESGSRQLFND
ncbi:nuclear transport factor 2 family protein [Paraferrimonas sp. SM1919]|uniref:nuclear transport factor 2 family protein n=1 Tax=Paraferrimonas sp. SM1919 TaxID=2662263 RepID=UPI0013D5B10E|nr:nuclear transport factor 2 family protein [Paraferrimonas sp. SM1919]